VDLIPAIDLLGGEAVRLVQGDYDRRAAHVADPASVLRAWVATGVRHLHLVDLDGARSGRPVNLAVAARLASAAREAGAVRVELGGGLRRSEDVEAAFEAGIDLAILGTAAVENPDLLAQAVARWPGRIAASVDVREASIALDGWTRTSDADAISLAQRLAEAGASQVIVTDTRRDGTGAGPNLELLDRMRAAVPDVRLVAAGGIGSADALRTLATRGIDGAIVGLALVDGSLSVADALEAVLAVA
jgi:phosphoribosylformimino-5-aminoimidazole carboxamide ribotide isomerase